MRLPRYLTISRPRFWIYLLGPALIGTAAALTQGGQWSWLAAVSLAIFSFPANLFLYGVNDIFDRETDQLNPKKSGYEHLLQPGEAKRLWRTSVAFLLPFVVGFFFLPRASLLSLLIFLYLGAFYSAPPIRAKAKPVLDSLFNVLYLMPALVAWYAFGGGAVSKTYVVAGAIWCMAMHAYSAIPDIAADRAAGIRTIATKFGKHKTLIICALLYGVSAILAYPLLKTSALIVGAVYVELMLISGRKEEDQLFRVYTWFPWINALTGALIFVTILAREW